MSDDDDLDELIRRRRRKSTVPGWAWVLLVSMVICIVIMIGASAHRAGRLREAPENASGRSAVTDSRETRLSSRQVRTDYDEPEGDPARGALWFACISATVLAYVVGSILMAVWVVKDARNRSVENGLIWMLLIFPFNFLALLIYLASRPHGLLIGCENCGNRRLAYVGVCPHCRQPVTPRGRVA